MPGNPFFKKTRLAPTPSGFLHVGNVMSFSVTAYLAQKYGAKILLRIDDMDRERTNPQYVRDIFETLRFLEIPWDEGPANEEDFQKKYSQEYRMPLYNQALEQLRAQGNVFACNCSRTQLASHAGSHREICVQQHLDLDEPGVNWRLFTPSDKQITINTLNGEMQYIFPHEMTDFIVRKRDRMPAYQLTSVIDDVHFGVDLVVRGDDLLASSISQVYLASLLESDSFQATTFFHHKLIAGEQGEKLSKSAGATSIQYLRQQKKKPSDIFSLISETLLLSEPAYNWEQLGARIVNEL